MCDPKLHLIHLMSSKYRVSVEVVTGGNNSCFYNLNRTRTTRVAP